MQNQIYGKMYIDGEWKESVAKGRIDISNPANNEIVGSVPDGTSEDVLLAIDAAKYAFYKDGEWRRMSATQRAEKLFEVANLLEDRCESIATIESIDNGKPLREAIGDISDAVYCFRYYAGLINKPSGDIYNVNDEFGKMHTYSISEPVGVCGLITPWNYPLLMSAWKIAPALAAGNSIVFKPSTSTPLSALSLFEIFEEVGMPKGTVNLVTGRGGAVGIELAKSHDVDMVSFTGSTSVGQVIAREATGNLKKIGLELGGKSPNIIFADADIESAVEWAMVGIFFNQGEVCSAGSRIIIEESIKDKFLSRLIERTEKLTIGDPLKDPDMGAIVSEEQMNTVLEYIEIGKKEGATCVAGGYRYVEGECAKGCFIKPTIFDNCTSDMRIVREEIFGPVVTVQTFKTEEEALEMANDTIYGLAGAVFTKDIYRAHRVILEIRAGITWVNCYNPTFSEAPWGGYKMSGIGRELGVHGLAEYQEIKQVNINLDENPLGWYPIR